MKKYSIFFAVMLLLNSCSSMREMAAEDMVYPLPENPHVSEVTDSVRMREIKSRIQSAPTTLISNSLKFENGAWHLGITREQADSVGISEQIYNEFDAKIKSLNQKGGLYAR